MLSIKKSASFDSIVDSKIAFKRVHPMFNVNFDCFATMWCCIKCHRGDTWENLLRCHLYIQRISLKKHFLV